jgi:hypothetical protein
MRIISLFPQNLGVQRRPSGYKPQSWTRVLIKSIDILGKYNQITSYRSPHSPTQCCHDFPLILNVVQQHCVGGRGGCFRQTTGIKLQFKLSQRQIKILLTSYVHDCWSHARGIFAVWLERNLSLLQSFSLAHWWADFPTGYCPIDKRSEVPTILTSLSEKARKSNHLPMSM